MRVKDNRQVLIQTVLVQHHRRQTRQVHLNIGACVFILVGKQGQEEGLYIWNDRVVIQPKQTLGIQVRLNKRHIEAVALRVWSKDKNVIVAILVDDTNHNLGQGRKGRNNGR